MMPQMLAMNSYRQPLQSSGACVFPFHTAIRRIMHQPLSRFSTYQRKRVDYVDTSQQNAR